MQIVEHTSKILKLKAKRGAWSFSGRIAVALFFGPTFFFAGLALMIVFGKVATLNCDRLESTQITCELTRSGLLSRNVKSIGKLKGAELEVGGDTDSDPTYRVVLIADNGKIPLNDIYSSSGSSGENVARINAFVNNIGETKLKIKQDYRWFAYPFGGIFMLAGTFAFLCYTLPKVLVACTLNKHSGRASLKLENIFLQSEIIEDKLDNIKMAQIYETVRSEGLNYDIHLILKSGESIYLGAFLNRSELAKAINQFLDANEQ